MGQCLVWRNICNGTTNGSIDLRPGQAVIGAARLIDSGVARVAITKRNKTTRRITRAWYGLYGADYWRDPPSFPNAKVTSRAIRTESRGIYLVLVHRLAKRAWRCRSPTCQGYDNPRNEKEPSGYQRQKRPGVGESACYALEVQSK